MSQNKRLIKCPECGFEGKPKKFSLQPKQIILRSFLWLFFLLPGFLYDMAIDNRFVCPKCKIEI
ncbi:MAG: hypothetical protein HZB79_11505 [Deltaproteobacteria bacterium]|nr:hypothetical protein [Deltaproteobacteria bacterium]